MNRDNRSRRYVVVKKVVVPGVFLAALSSPLFMEEVQAASNTQYVEVNAGSVLNVRGGPSVSTSIVTTLKAGAKVNVLSETNGWSKVDANGKVGYVNKQYIKVQEGNVINNETTNSEENTNTASNENTENNEEAHSKENDETDEK